MRKLFVLHVIILSIAFSQPYVLVEGDSVEFGMLNLNRNCGAEFVMDVELVENSFIITAIDSGGMATCGSCYFNVEAVVSGLEPGEYEATFYTRDIYDMAPPDSTSEYWINIRDTTYIGTESFEVLSPPISHYSILSSYASPCSHTQSAIEVTRPDQHVLVGNYPNPFNNSTKIEFTLADDDFVKVTVYDLQGREIDELAVGEFSSGLHQMTWEAANFDSGIYLLTVSSSRFMKTSKLLLLK